MATRRQGSNPLREESFNRREIEDNDDAPKYVIQRSGELIREWWTGKGWSEDVNDALQYSSEPDVSVESLDESAIAVRLDDIDG